MGTMEYTQETRDLAQLVASRVSQSIHSVIQLSDGPDQALQITLMAAGTAIGSATGAISAKYGNVTQAEAMELLFGLLSERSKP